MGIEGLDQFGKVGQRAGQAVDLVDHDNVDRPGTDVGQHLLQGRPVHRCPRQSTVVVVLG